MIDRVIDQKIENVVRPKSLIFVDSVESHELEQSHRTSNTGKSFC